MIDINSSNTRSISVNNSFRRITFPNNENNRKNFTIRTIYKSNTQTHDTGTNIKYKPVKKGMQKGEKQWLTLEEKLRKLLKKKSQGYK